ncbi:DUF2798 domain-containing protein [Vibrio chagasii]|nr:DUF2798 domain-containing protein [Vibrio chagasii]
MVSAWVTYINLGLPEDFISRWGFAFINLSRLRLQQPT